MRKNPSLGRGGTACVMAGIYRLNPSLHLPLGGNRTGPPLYIHSKPISSGTLTRYRQQDLDLCAYLLLGADTDASFMQTNNVQR